MTSESRSHTTTCLITGATSGIGLAAAKELATRGMRLLVVGRDAARGEAARREIARAGDPSNVELLLADLSSQNQVRALATAVLDRYDRLDLLINNAGLVLDGRQLTDDGIETTFAVNHLAPFLLTTMLLPLLEASAPARIITVASDAHKQGELDLDAMARGSYPGGWQAYATSKLANILFTTELARRLEGSGVVANCLHPGVVRTGFGRTGPFYIRTFFAAARLFLISPEKGAETIIHLATNAAAGKSSGTYYVRCKPATPTAAARDKDAARRLWQLSEQLVRPAGNQLH